MPSPFRNRFSIASLIILGIYAYPIYANDGPFKVSGLGLLQPAGVVPAALVSPYVVPLKYISSEAAIVHIKALFPEMKAAQSDGVHRVIVMCTDREIGFVRKAIDSLDTPSKQLQFDVEIVEVSHDFRDHYSGLLLDSVDGFSINYDFSKNAVHALSNLEAVLSALISSGNAKLLSKPHLTILDTKTAHIQVGDRIPYTTTVFHNNSSTVQVNFIDTGIQLDISARITSGNRIVADIHSEISSVRSWREFNSVQFPVISSRKTQSIVQLRDQQTLVIAGLLDESTHRHSSHIPFLWKLPWIGKLFRSSTEELVQTDVLFMITPRISGG